MCVDDDEIAVIPRQGVTKGCERPAEMEAAGCDIIGGDPLGLRICLFVY